MVISKSKAMLAGAAALQFFVLCAAAGEEQPKSKSAGPGAMSELVELELLNVIPLPSKCGEGLVGGIVLLKEKNGKLIVPISVGGREAEAMQLRETGAKFERPLTHDLLDEMIRILGGKLEKFVIDDMQARGGQGEGVFLGRLFIRRGEQLYSVDARPSDCIVMAIGAKTPMYATRRVVQRTGKTKDELLNELRGGSAGGEKPTAPPGPPL